MRTVFILVDALRSDYLLPENMPFLYKLAKGNIYVKKVVPSFGYCERTEIFTGMRPDKSNNFTAIGYDAALSEYKRLNLLFHLLAPFERFDKKNYCRRILKRLLRNTDKKMQLYQIPFSDISKFRLTEDYHSHYMQGAFCKESFFDMAGKAGARIITDAFTALGEKSRFSSDNERIQFVYSQWDKEFDCLLFYIPNIDSVGHLHTDKRDLMCAELRKIDLLIEDIYKKFSAVEGTRFLVLGDHGMEPILDTINVRDEIEKLDLKRGKDYDMFLDSTVARFWVKKEESKIKLEECLSRGEFREKGFLVDEKSAELLHIPNNARNSNGQRLYGDIIWAANNGVLISPDYFNQGKEITGMHSYSQKSPLSCGLAVVAGTEQPPMMLDECSLIDICPTLCDLVNISYPDGNEGVSLLKRKK